MSVRERTLAEGAVHQLEAAVFTLLCANAADLRTGEVARLLGIESHCPTPNSNWLARCLLESLVTQGRARSERQGSARLFRAL